MEAAAVGFLGILVGALIGWFAGLAVARRSHDYAIELWRLDRDARASDLRKALGEEMRGNLALLEKATATERRHHAPLQTSAWTAAIGMKFQEDQSRQFVQAAYVTGAQYNEAVRQIPPMGQASRGEGSNLALELARSARAAFTEGERLYVANGEDPATPSAFRERAAERTAASVRDRGLRRRLTRAVAAFREGAKS
jgi:hypothetical protein